MTKNRGHIMHQGRLKKMNTQVDANNMAEYHLPVGDALLPMRDYLGRTIHIHFDGQITCVGCQRAIKKTFNQGYCFVCLQKLAQCDLCIVKPERCHYHLGTCREPRWGEEHCMQDHVVYLANSSSLKVGITRVANIPSRWVDQGATQALPILTVKSRYISGLVEVMLKESVNDKTNWRKMLQGSAEPVDLVVQRDTLLSNIDASLQVLKATHGDDAYRIVDSAVRDIDYPVTAYPTKIQSLNLDKTAIVSGTLLGIKAQYLILDKGVLNIRKFAGYHVSVSVV